MMAERRRFEAELTCTEVPDFACVVSGCKAAWGTGNQFYVSAGSRRPFRDEPSGVSFGNMPYIHVFKWDTDMYSPFTRKLVNEACSIFVKSQKLSSLQTSMNRSSLILKYSREYRSVIKACIMELHNAVKTCAVSTTAGDVVELLEMLEMSELLWSLCEILLIDVMPGGMVLRQLLDWWQLRFLEYDAKANAVINSGVIENDEIYWQAVIYFILQGRIDDARHMLSLHSEFPSAAYCKMDGLLKSMPLYNKLVGVSSAEFLVRWQAWNTECKSLRDQNFFITEPKLHLICRILTGEEQVFYELRNLLGTWYCMLISKMLYSNPTVQAADLQFFCHDCISVYGSESSLRSWDSIILAAMELDIHQVIHRCSTEFRNWWLVTHLTDLLHHHGILQPHMHNFGASLREFLILEYATSLVSHCSLWQVGFTYLEHCPVFGRHFITCFTQHAAIKSERKAHKLLNICAKNELTDEAKSICKVMGVQALHNNQTGSALLWGMRSKDAAFVAFISDKYLHEYHGSGSFSSLDLIDNLGSSMLLTTELTFLGKYREFHQMYAKSQFDEAAGLLLCLLTTGIAPKKFWPMLLLDAIPLLESEKINFGMQQTYELLHCLEELEITQKLDSSLVADTLSTTLNSACEAEREKMTILRLALARNLARSAALEESV